jgi:hypothetical protein
MTWWPFLIPPAAVGAFAVGHLAGVAEGAIQVYLDERAPVLLVAAILVYAVRAIITRNPLYVILTCLCLAFFCRENQDVPPFDWHEWAHKGIFVMLGLLGAWAVVWRKRIAEPLRDYRHTSWLLATLWAYALAFLIYKRTFRFVPGEADTHNFLEEGVETAAHLMLVLTASLGSLARRGRNAEG